MVDLEADHGADRLHEHLGAGVVEVREAVGPIIRPPPQCVDDSRKAVAVPNVDALGHGDPRHVARHAEQSRVPALGIDGSEDDRIGADGSPSPASVAAEQQHVEPLRAVPDAYRDRRGRRRRCPRRAGPGRRGCLRPGAGGGGLQPRRQRSRCGGGEGCWFRGGGGREDVGDGVVPLHVEISGPGVREGDHHQRDGDEGRGHERGLPGRRRRRRRRASGDEGVGGGKHSEGEECSVARQEPAQRSRFDGPPEPHCPVAEHDEQDEPERGCDPEQHIATAALAGVELARSRHQGAERQGNVRVGTPPWWVSGSGGARGHRTGARIEAEPARERSAEGRGGPGGRLRRLMAPTKQAHL